MEQKYSTAFATKDPIDTVQAYNDVDDSPPTGLDCCTDEMSRRKSSRRGLKRRHCKR